MGDIRFLSLEDALTLHDDTIVEEGGEPGVLDLGLLDSAVSMARQQLGGEYLHPDLPSMAAAYLFHLAMNHGFVDGNKRVAFLAAMVFLLENGKTIDASPTQAETMVLAVARGEMDKQQIARWVNEHLVDA